MAAAEQVIQGILQQIETAWNRYDSVSLAAAFAEDANFIPNLWGTVGRAGCHRGGAPAHLRDDLQRQPCQFRATIPGGFDLLQDSLDDLLSCGHDCPPE